MSLCLINKDLKEGRDLKGKLTKTRLCLTNLRNSHMASMAEGKKVKNRKIISERADYVGFSSNWKNLGFYYA